MTTIQFIEKARKIHGDKYDYSKVEYINSDTEVCIICPVHGEFWQKPSNHYRGGCKKCSLNKLHKKRAFKNETFIKKAKKTHGDKYDYSKVEYKNKDTKVCIICPEHGEFWQKPNIHYKGSHCPKCAKKNQVEKTLWSTRKFVNKAQEVHGNKYDYSKTEYQGALEYLTVICPKHGEFRTTANNHLRGCLCPECANEKYKKTQKDFLIECKKIHGNKYDYTKTEYTGDGNLICIICHEKDENGIEHGEFWQKAGQHIRTKNGRKIGCGCPKCAKNYRYTTEEIIKRAIKEHGEKYNYSKSKYINMHTKMIVMCPNHGEFLVSPTNHLRGRGCPHCKESKGEKTIRKYLKHNNIEFIPQHKFDWLISERKQRLDFYIPELNIAIEYQGVQHSKPCSFGSFSRSADEAFTYMQKLDENKKRLCEQNGVKLFYINYDENIDKKLNEIFGG